MSKGLDRKKQKVSDVTKLLKTSKSMVVFEYTGIGVIEFTKLRSELAEKKIIAKIYKNSILKYVFDELKISDINQHLFGQNCLAFSDDPEVNVAKEINNFLKTKPKLNFKAAYFDGQILDGPQTLQLAKLATKPELISMFLSCLQAPVRNFAVVLSEVAKKKEEATTNNQ